MKRTVFYFDDDLPTLGRFRGMFGDAFNVTTATGLGEARRVLAECAPDIIICDQVVPEIDGAEFLRQAAAACPDAFRILVTGYAGAGDVPGEIGGGIINVLIPKPWAWEHMRQVLERAAALLDWPGRPRRPEGERRMAPRHKVRLETRVLMVATEGGGEKVLPLCGHTRDVSESGLALIVSGEDMEALSGLGPSYTLQLVLRLPTGPVDLTVNPVRHQRLERDEGYLVGAEITDMSGRDRVRFMEYVRGLARRGPA